MLPLQPLRQKLLVEAASDQVLVMCALAGEDRPAHIDERQDQRRLHPLVFGLHVIDHALMLDISIEAGNHNLSLPKKINEWFNLDHSRGAILISSTSIFRRSIISCSEAFSRRTVCSTHAIPPTSMN